MRKVYPQKAYYEIKEKLGEGLTSEVYKAFRVDQTAWTKQVVALKIIKSKKNVQILKREFEKLTKVQSKYCVQMKSWENLPQGSALVLEYIDGVTLHELDQAGILTAELIEEVVMQIHLGLLALHRAQVFHGDLNLKNVIINTDGVIKLIDFGFFNSEKENWVTPFFASPQILKGDRPNSQSDLYSLGKIKSYLERNLFKDNKVTLEFDLTEFIKNKNTKASRRRSLSNVIKNLCLRNKKGTVVIPKLLKNSQWELKLTKSIGFCLFFLLILIPLDYKSPEYGGIELRTKDWASLSINGMPKLFSPLQIRKLRVGKYNLDMKSSQIHSKRLLNLQKDKTIVLNLKNINL